MSEVNLQQLEARIVKLEEAHPKLAAAHSAFLEVQTSRRGTQGAKGDPGSPSTAPGPAGRDAKILLGRVSHGTEASANLRDENGTQVLDLTLPSGAAGKHSTVPGPPGSIGATGAQGIPGSVTVATRAANAAVESKFAEFLRNLNLPALIRAELQSSGVIDENGRAILAKPKDGIDGKDSVVPGPAGKDGVSVKGDTGSAGSNGIDGVSPDTNILIGQLETRLSRLWKEDFQCALRGHLQESPTHLDELAKQRAR